jgi:hypothetical protein
MSGLEKMEGSFAAFGLRLEMSELQMCLTTNIASLLFR